VTRLAAFVAAAVGVAAASFLGIVVATRSQGAPKPLRGVTAGASTALRVARTRLGRILVDARGHTLYLFLKDRHGRSACGARCARVWPPLILSGPPRLETGISRRKLSTTRRADGRRQVVYNGHPLYALTADTRPGQTRGQGFLGTWYAISPAGQQVGGRGRSPPATY
jgi:predicted lipoprotein with Yx(FWY)xxD motif